jgi:hypothetical protein
MAELQRNHFKLPELSWILIRKTTYGNPSGKTLNFGSL